MSGPVPSPSMNGMMGWSGTLQLPVLDRDLRTVGGGYRLGTGHDSFSSLGSGHRLVQPGASDPAIFVLRGTDVNAPLGVEALAVSQAISERPFPSQGGQTA